MTTVDQIADYLKSLKLKSAMMGYEKDSVLEALQSIDEMYQDVVETEKAKLQTLIDGQTDKLAENDQQMQTMAESLGALRKQNEALEEKVTALQSQLAEANTARTEYLKKRDMLAAAILKWQKDEETQRSKFASEQEELLAAAKREAAEITQRVKREAAAQRDSILAEAEHARNALEAAFWQIAQLRDRLGALLSDEHIKIAYVEPKEGRGA